jgi:hypothetical protein
MTMLVRLDGSVLAAKSLEYLLALPHADRLEYVLVEVVPPAAEHARAEA